MNKFFVATALVASSASVHAADLSAKAPSYKAAAAQVYDWTGFYAGVNLGIGVGQSKGIATNPAGENFLNLTPSGTSGGGQFGYNYQFNHWLVGAEADIQGIARFQSSSTPCVLNCNLVGQTLPWFGTARGRVGYVTGPLLTYVTGGYAYGSVKTGQTIVLAGVPGSFSSESLRSGWTWGSGVEAALGGNWTGKIEYLYVDLGNVSESFALHGVPHTLSADVHEHIFRTGLNYRFGGTNTVTAALPLANWRGFYLGGNGGSGLARDRFLHTVGAPISTSENLYELPRGFLGGVQAGYNWQAENLVFGVEADFQGSTQKDDRTCLANCTQFNRLQYDQKLPWLGTVRGRLGYSLGDTLFYATGGLAYGQVKTVINKSFGQMNVVSLSRTKTGWTAGGGVETPFEFLGWFGKNWTSKTEYLYVDLGSNANSFVTATGPVNLLTGLAVTNTFSTHVSEHIFRTGLNYHFN